MNDNLRKICGALEEVGDVRTYDYDIVCGSSSDKASSYPVKYEIEAPKVLKCKNQENVGACVAEVIAQVSEAYFGKEMSEGHIYAAFRSDGTRCYGMYPQNALKDWRNISTILLQYFNHLVEMPELLEDLKEIPELDALYDSYKITGYVSLNYFDLYKKDCSIKDALLGPANKYGLIAICNEYFGDSHCVWLTGWDDDKDCYCIKNSWGESWGNTGDGRGYVPKSEVNQVYMVLFEDLKLPFTDVSESDWFYKDVRNMYCSGLMNGKSETLFDPNGVLTRAEAAAVFNRITAQIDKKFAILSTLLNIKTEEK